MAGILKMTNFSIAVTIWVCVHIPVCVIIIDITSTMLQIFTNRAGEYYIFEGTQHLFDS